MATVSSLKTLTHFDSISALDYDDADQVRIKGCYTMGLIFNSESINEKV